eukprot:TRINITY_DN11258_c0_g1_i3.p1 TRINITY_DN11258_c0_g1~~TRINITY_DN11258_c0_g1_i3.p1  ORF type:complete len:380 (-),score=58.82 TRINITY_DN11258_c0_g1_i3:211-1350(-)
MFGEDEPFVMELEGADGNGCPAEGSQMVCDRDPQNESMFDAGAAHTADPGYQPHFDSGPCPVPEPPSQQRKSTLRQNYRHLRTIRQSIYGKIKYGEHKASGEKVAVKICSLALIARWRAAHLAAVSEGKPWNECRIEDPYAEAQVMRVLAEPGHPNIVRLAEVIEDAENLHIVMEFANGGDIFDILRAGVLTEDWSRHLFRQLVEAIRYCHSRNVVHGDVSPENCLVTNNATIKLADFGGSAMHNPSGFGRERVVGKSFYMAPEILMLFDEPPTITAYDGFAADVWSCGIIFFLMLTGGKVAPFAIPHLSDRWFKLLAEEGVLAHLEVRGIKEQVSAAACDLLSKVLVLEPSARLSPLQILEHPWFAMNGSASQQQPHQ